MHTVNQQSAAKPAIVARHVYDAGAAEQYLVLAPNGAASWTANSRVATAFESMREATRAALHLSAACRAFGLPLGAEAASRTAH